MKFGETISKNLHQQVFSFTQYLIDHPSVDIINIHPAYSSVMVSLDNNASLSRVSEYLQIVLTKVIDIEYPKPRIVEVPVMYGGENGPDLKRVADHTGLTPVEVIKRHSDGDYLVYFIGFSIGFPYLGGMDESISTTRLEVPRKYVSAGSIGIAGNQTGIYPMSSPGGWNLIGRTPLSIFNAEKPEESPVKMGDKVRFRPIDETEFDALAENQ